MEPQRRKKADHPVGDPYDRRRKRLVLTEEYPGARIQAATSSLKLASGNQTAEGFAGHANAIEIASTYESSLRGQGENAFGASLRAAVPFPRHMSICA